MKRRKAKKIFHGYTQDNSCRLVRSGKEYFALLIHIINEAKESIHLQVYIYEDDDTGKEVGAALIAAAQRGVKVYLMVDGYASGSLSKSFVKHITDGGVNFRFFDPLFKSRSFY